MAEKDDFDDSGGQVASHGNSLRPQTPPKTAGNASDAKAGKNNIKVFMRVRPAAKPFSGYQPDPENQGIAFEVIDKDDKMGHVDNRKQTYRYKFDGIFDMDTTQEQVFNVVAKPVIDDAMAGVNGTIFAYGQTGSGKTYTITGGSERYVDRGLIPRTLSDIFERIRNDPHSSYRMYISYLEIYNDYGYDLLSREDSATKLEDLPKVQLREDGDGNIHLLNLSVNMANTEEDALNLLFLGDTNRVVAETPMNDASTRSHCLFIIWVESTKHGSDTVRRSKIHLVDLAGSERISKTGVTGTLQSEARYINVSLYHLEMVIVALHERTTKGRQHIPYRNSMMTSILRDSLGGNCKTVMIGNCAVETSNIDETLTTCRFAQRVSMITNVASVNEDLDPKLMVKRLKREVEELKAEIRELKGEDGGDMEVQTSADGVECLSQAAIDACRKTVEDFITDRSLGSISYSSRLRAQEMFRLFREMVVSGGGIRPGAAGGNKAAIGDGKMGVSGGESGPELERQVKQLKLEIAQRDQEIGILVEIVNRNGSKGGGAGPSYPAPLSSSTAITSSSSANNATDVVEPSSARHQVTTEPPYHSTGGAGAEKTAGSGGATSSTAAPSSRPTPSSSSSSVPKGREAAELLMDRNKAFEVFRKSVRRNESYEENKELLRNLMAEAKQFGVEANSARNATAPIKQRIQQLRLERAMTTGESGDDGENGGSSGDGNGAGEVTDPLELELLQQLEENKRTYTEQCDKLRKAKREIDRLQGIMEQNTKRLQRDFEQWYGSLRREADKGIKEIVQQVKTGEIDASEVASFTQNSSKISYPSSQNQSTTMDASTIISTSATPRSSNNLMSGSHLRDSTSSHGTTRYNNNQGAPRVTGDAAINEEIKGFYKALGKM